MRSIRRIYHICVGYLTGNLLLHHKGGVYRRLHCGTDSTNERAGTRITVYLSIKFLTVHIRTDAEMYEPVIWPDGKERPRFAPYRCSDARR